MQQIFVYEWTCGGGLLGCPKNFPARSFMAEGQAMLAALIDDLLAFRATHVVTLLADGMELSPHKKLTVHPAKSADRAHAAFERLAGAADWTIVIAPECNGELLARCQLVERAGGRLLCGSLEAVAICSDKQATAELLSSNGVPTPVGMVLSPPAAIPRDLVLPAVIKPRDGAGCCGVGVIRSPSERDSIRIDAPVRLERYHNGLAASVVVICGRKQLLPLIACRQHIAHGLTLAYVGGSLPLPQDLEQRASDLAVRAIKSLPAPFGWYGVDLVLGDALDGGDDVVIEINSRLTTSYLGLSAACETNLAGALVAIADGGQPEVSFRPEVWEFDIRGNTRKLFDDNRGNWQ